MLRTFIAVCSILRCFTVLWTLLWTNEANLVLYSQCPQGKEEGKAEEEEEEEERKQWEEERKQHGEDEDDDEDGLDDDHERMDEDHMEALMEEL